VKEQKSSDFRQSALPKLKRQKRGKKITVDYAYQSVEPFRKPNNFYHMDW